MMKTTAPEMTAAKNAGKTGKNLLRKTVKFLSKAIPIFMDAFIYFLQQ